MLQIAGYDSHKLTGKGTFLLLQKQYYIKTEQYRHLRILKKCSYDIFLWEENHTKF